MSNDWKKVESASESWKYENVNDEVMGVYEKMEENVGPNNSNMYTLRQEDGELIGVWGNSVLNDKFATIPFGDEVKIIYTGKKTSPKTNRQYNTFEVYHRTPDNVSTNANASSEETEDIPF